MAAPTPSWNLVRCYGTWTNLSDGSKKAGSYKVTISQRITSAVDDTIVPAGVFATGSLSTAGSGASLDIQVPASDDPDVSPNGFTVQVDVVFSDGTTSETFFVKPSINGSGTNLRTVVIPSSAAAVAILQRGVPGGIAELDSDGDVINAARQKVVSLGGGGSGGGPVTAADITDATTVTRNFIRAVDAAAARAAIGAGISSLALGTTASTAKAGNWLPGVADISGTTGTRSSTTFLRGDGSWVVPSGAPAATTSAAGIVQLAGDLGGTSASPTVPGLADKQNASAQHTLAQLAPGACVVIDYYKPVFGAANAWPTTRPTNRVDLDVTWRGPTDPGNIMLVGDMFDLTGA